MHRSFVSRRFHRGLVPQVLVVGGLLALGGCQGAPAPAPSPVDNRDGRENAEPGADERLIVASNALLRAEPHKWSEQIAAVHALGAAAAPHLVAAVLRDPAAPGAPAVIGLLGLLGDADAVRHLEDLVLERSVLAVEAALALGQLRARSVAQTLLDCANDRFADATLRTAAGCAAARMGQRRDVANLLRGVMLAGTPQGQELQAELGLPEKPRWAYERYLIQRLLRDEAPDELSFDTDASWAELEQAANRLSAWLTLD